MSADELLDRFVNGEVSAHCLYDTAKTFYITELDMDSEEVGCLFHWRSGRS